MQCGSPVIWLVLASIFAASPSTVVTSSLTSPPIDVANYFGALPNCTPPTIDDFPPDMFDQEQRRDGWVTVHFVLAIYVMLMIGIVIDEYFVPSLEIIATVLKMSPNVAGATIMAVGTSSPELFINIVGTFITQGDIGVGTIVGSAVFNILAAPACCGLFTGFVVALEWWPLTRDCVLYSITVIALGIILVDGRIYWWEALILVLFYAVFLFLMSKNQTLQKYVTKTIGQLPKSCADGAVVAEDDKADQSVENNLTRKQGSVTDLEVATTEEELLALKGSGKDGSVSLDVLGEETNVALDVSNEQGPKDEQVEEGDDDEGPVELFKWPSSSSRLEQLYWIVMWPGNLIFALTVPDVRRQGFWKSLYPLTFGLCVIWIGSLTYVVTWFITVIGHTLGIPDSAMGITFLAAGGSVPEAVATVVVARQGKGSMGISNSVGSNSFDIMICMGLPWLIKAIAMPAFPSEGNFVLINSGGVVFSVGMLFTTVMILYFSLALNNFMMDRKIGFLLLVSYVLFLILAGCLELNIFYEVNPPAC